MSKIPFAPPNPCVTVPDQETIEEMKNMTSKELRQFKKSAAYKKHVRPALNRHKSAKRKAVAEWWKNNWIALLSLIFAIIAAIPVIAQGVVTMLELLG